MLWNSMGSLCNLGCQWLITVLIVRFARDYNSAGIYSLAMSVFNTFSQVAQYRTYTIQVSDVRGENTVGEYLGFRFLTCGATFVIAMGYALATCRPNSIPAIALYLVFKLAGLIIDVLHANNQLHHRMDYIGKSFILQGVSSLVAFVFGFGLFGSLELALVLMIVSVFAIGLLYDLPRARSFAVIKPGITWDKSVRLLVGYAPVVLASIAFAASTNIPRQYLSAIMGDSALGIYASVAAPVAIIQMGASYVYNPLLSYFSERYVEKNCSGFVRLMVLTSVGIVFVGIACSVALQFLSGPLLSLVYGESIVDYLYLVQPLVLCAVVTGLTWFVNDLLIAMRNFSFTLYGSVAGFAASLASMVPALAMFGMNGVTVACLASCALCNVVMLMGLVSQAKRWFGGEGTRDDFEL